MGTYSPPANLTDFNNSPNKTALFNAWDQYIAGLVKGGSNGNPTLAHVPAFFDPMKAPAGVQTATPTWNGFPGAAMRLFGAAAGGKVAPVAARFDAALAFGAADPNPEQTTQAFQPPGGVFYRPQDEYLEWAVHRDAKGAITEILFTCESPDYWSQMFQGDPNLTLGLYQHLCGNTTIALKQLTFAEDTTDTNSGITYKAGSYNPYNALNRDFAVHLTQLANNLFAEIVLAKEASLLWGKPTTTTDPARICCAGYGEPNRNSDPTIGAGVNDAVLANNFVTLLDPIALYIQGWDSSPITVNGQPLPNADQLFQVLRGDQAKQQILRIRFAVPTGMTVGGAPLTLSQLSVAAEPLTTGGQVANLIKMHLFAGVAPGKAQTAHQPCTGKACFLTGNPSFIVPIAVKDTCPPNGTPLPQQASAVAAKLVIPKAGKRLTRAHFLK